MTQEITSSSYTRRVFLKSGASSLAFLGLMGVGSTALADAAKSTNLNSQSSSKTANELKEVGAQGYYTLPPLPYLYNALEPFIDEQTMRLHHDMHFESYRNGLNDALQKLERARKNQNFDQISALENSLAFNGAGYVLHTVFFSNMNVANSSQPSSWLQERMIYHFGSLDAFKAQFSAVALGIQGSGWTILGYQPLGEKYIILQVEKHQNATQWNIIPILALDVWEHAYYLKYQNRRKDYVQNWWNVVNWQNVEERMRLASAIKAF